MRFLEEVGLGRSLKLPNVVFSTAFCQPVGFGKRVWSFIVVEMPVLAL